MRLLVQEPMKTASTATSLSGMPGVRSMYSIARSAAARSFASVYCDGVGTTSLSETPWPGFVPQVTKGSSSFASRNTSAS